MATTKVLTELEYLRGKVQRLEREKALAIECWEKEEAHRVVIENELREMTQRVEWYQQHGAQPALQGTTMAVGNTVGYNDQP